MALLECLVTFLPLKQIFNLVYVTDSQLHVVYIQSICFRFIFTIVKINKNIREKESARVYFVFINL